jgi:hypothetical protein
MSTRRITMMTEDEIQTELGWIRPMIYSLLHAPDSGNDRPGNRDASGNAATGPISGSLARPLPHLGKCVDRRFRSQDRACYPFCFHCRSPWNNH